MVGNVTTEMVPLVSLVMVGFHSERNQRQGCVFVIIRSKTEETRML